MNRCIRSVVFFGLLSLLFCPANRAFAAQVRMQGGRDISGSVTDINGEAIPGATILVKGTNHGTTSDESGEYLLRDVAGEATLVFSFIGMRTVEEMVGDRTIIHVVLEEDAVGLEEVVAIGYGSMKKKDLTGSVASVSTEDMASLPLASMGDAMQGKAAGVHVIASGIPGTDPTFRIRGTGTINNNDPLFVIDGIPTSSGLNQINMDDVESIHILKDASATAIYGARGANGVVIVTTRDGSSGNGQVNFNASFGLQEATGMVKVLQANEFAALHNDMMLNGGMELNPAYADPGSLGKGTDWVGALLRTAPVENYSLSYSGGNDKTGYYLSGNYFDQEGIIDNTGFKRISLKFNSNSQIKKRVKVGNMLTLNHDKRYSGSYSILNTLRALPTQPIYNEDGSYSGPVARSVWDGDITNPIGQAEIIENTTRGYNLLGSVYMELEIVKGLVFKTTAGLNTNFWQNRTWSPAYDWSPTPQELSYLSQESNMSNTWNWDNTFTYHTSFGEGHNLTLLAGTSAQENRFSIMNGSIQEFASDETQQLNNGLSQKEIGGTGSEWSLMSYMARANYAFRDKYLVTGTVRRDGSSRFGPNNRWGIFPSGSLAWRVSEEDFFQGQEFMDYLKIRAGYGVTGNQEILNYVFAAALTTIKYNFNDYPVNGVVPYIMPNPNVQWESQKQANIGFDATMLDQRLSLIFDLYQKKTEDMLVEMDVPILSGYSDEEISYINAGEIVNKGIELTVTSHNVKGLYNWDTDFNISINRNEVISLNDTIPLPRGSVGFNQNLARCEAGYPVDAFYGFVTNGIFQDQEEVEAHAQQFPGEDPYSRTSAGDIRFLDLNSDGIIDDEDRTYIGDPNPEFIFSLTNRFSYGGFDLNIFLQGVVGNDLYNANRIWNEGMSVAYNQTTAVLNRWTGPGSETTVPRAVYNDPNKNTRPSNRFIEDGSYLRIKNVILGYSFPGSLLRRIGIASARLYLSGVNLWTFTRYQGFDPEVGVNGIDLSTYPVTRTLSVGINMGF